MSNPSYVVNYPRESFTAADFRGWQFINAAAEFPSPHDPVHQEAARHKIAMRKMLCETAKAAGAAGG